MSARDVVRELAYVAGAAVGIGVLGLGAVKDSHPTVYVGAGVAVLFAYLADPARMKDAITFLSGVAVSLVKAKAGGA